MMTDYSQYPAHPLAGIPQEVLDIARDYLQKCVIEGDLDNPHPEIVESIADSVVLLIVEAGYKIIK